MAKRSAGSEDFSRRDLFGGFLRRRLDDARAQADERAAPRRTRAGARSREERLRAAWGPAERTSIWEPVGAALVEAVEVRAGNFILDAGAWDRGVWRTAGRRGAMVTGWDSLPRSEAGPPTLTNLPFAGSAFNHALSALVLPFAADPQAALAELFRVVRPEGRVALATWQPMGPIGVLMRMVLESDPPPGGADSPLIWGVEEHLFRRLSEHAPEPLIQGATIELAFASQADAVARLEAAFPPLGAAIEALPDDGRRALRARVAELVAGASWPADDGIRLEAEYLLAWATKPRR